MKLPTPEDTRNPAGYVSRRNAAKLFGVSVRWLESQTSIPKINLARPGARRATWRYSLADLVDFMENRKIVRAAPDMRRR